MNMIQYCLLGIVNSGLTHDMRVKMYPEHHIHCLLKFC